MEFFYKNTVLSVRLFIQRLKSSNYIHQYIHQNNTQCNFIFRNWSKIGRNLVENLKLTVKLLSRPLIHEMEIVLDRTTKLYMEALKERRQMINQWTRQRSATDNDIQNSLKVYMTNFFQFLRRIQNQIYVNCRKSTHCERSTKKKRAILKKRNNFYKTKL